MLQRNLLQRNLLQRNLLQIKQLQSKLKKSDRRKNQSAFDLRKKLLRLYVLSKSKKLSRIRMLRPIIRVTKHLPKKSKPPITRRKKSLKMKTTKLRKTKRKAKAANE